MLVELGLVEQRYKAVLEVLDGVMSVTDVRRYGVGRQTVHTWLRRYAAEGLPGLVDQLAAGVLPAPDAAGDRGPRRRDEASASGLGTTHDPQPPRPCRELARLKTEDHWYGEAERQRRHFRLVRLSFGAWGTLERSRTSAGAAWEALKGAVQSSALGAVLFLLVIVTERGASRVWPNLIPEVAPPFSLFPTLAVQVTAALLGFYFAAVSIVLGNAYLAVSASIRQLVLDDSRSQTWLWMIGAAIGAGLVLVLLESVGIPVGYFTVGTYVLLVVTSGWAFSRLAFGAFRLLDPVSLASEPLRGLRRSIRRSRTRGLLGDDAVLRDMSDQADWSLGLIAELIDITSQRSAGSSERLSQLVTMLQWEVREYAREKYRLPPSSSWFRREPEYPRWVESDWSAVSRSLRISTPLIPTMRPGTEWLEVRAAELSAAALAGCLANSAQNPALRITEEVTRSAHEMARSYRVEEAVVIGTHELQPVQSKSEPDAFGEALFTLVHHVEGGIASGDHELVRTLFGTVLIGSLRLDAHVRSTYTAPTYQVNSAILDPVVDLLELSGLALVYEALRRDDSAAPVRDVWTRYLDPREGSEAKAQVLLNLLDLANGGFVLGLSPRSVARTEWEMRLSAAIRERGLARPSYTPWDTREWKAPLLFRMLGASEDFPSISLDPRAVFAAQILGPRSGETEEELRLRPGLRRYFEERDFHSRSSDDSAESDAEDG